MDYALIDCGNGRKLERFGPYTLIRPAGQAIWSPLQSEKQWQAQAHALFSREKSGGWKELQAMPSQWEIVYEEIRLKLKKTDFGHLGVFPEHGTHWRWIREKLKGKKGKKVLNLFAYSGGATLAAAMEGAQVCHVDSAKGMVNWARENAQLNHLEKAPIRWIVEDAVRYLQRVAKRQEYYDGIILDPPSFGRGAAGQVFKIEEDLPRMLELCKSILSPNPSFILLSCHTPGFTPIVLKQLMEEYFPSGNIEMGEMELVAQSKKVLPSGCFVRWVP